MKLAIAAVQIALDFNGLTQTQIAQLVFFEVGIDPQIVQRDDRHQRLPGRDALTQLHVALRHIAAHRRDDGVAMRHDEGIAITRHRISHPRVVTHRATIDQHMRGRSLLLRLL